MLTALACWPTGPLLAQKEAPSPRHKISAEQLHSALSARFPVRLVVAGLLALKVSAPRLLLLPARDQLGATLVMQLHAQQLQPIAPGELDVVFALRYEATDQTVRAHQLDILALRWPGLRPEILQVVQGQLRAAARETLGELVLHKFLPRELALAETMGLEPKTLRVVDDGLLVLLGPKLLR